MQAAQDEVRLDKWLWAARFYKTRSLASQAIAAGKVQINGTAVKASRIVHAGDVVTLRQPPSDRTVKVLALSQVRGPAPAAQSLYEETPESVLSRQRAAQARRDGVEPAWSLQQGRPTKRDRRDLVQWQRWSAALPPED